MARRPFYAPNAAGPLMEKWRSDGRIRAVGALICRGGTMSGRDLAGVLGMSPRGLRQFLVKDDLITVEMREEIAARGERRAQTWYRINPEALPPAIDPPPVSVAGRSRPGNRGPQLRATSAVALLEG